MGTQEVNGDKGENGGRQEMLRWGRNGGCGTPSATPRPPHGTSGDSALWSIGMSWPRDMAMARIIWSSSDMLRSWGGGGGDVMRVYGGIFGVPPPPEGLRPPLLTRTTPPMRGGGWVSRYSVACSMVLVLSRASMACSREKPMSISCRKGANRGLGG